MKIDTQVFYSFMWTEYFIGSTTNSIKCSEVAENINVVEQML